MKKYAFTLHELVDLLSNEMSNSHEGCRVHSFCIISNELGCISLFCHTFPVSPSTCLLCLVH